VTWLIIVVACLTIFGSVYWLKPSARDQRLAAMRMTAIKQGVHVRYHSFQPDSAKTGVRDVITGTAYSLLKQPSKPAGDLLYRVVGQVAWDNECLPEGLAWHDKPENAAVVGQVLAEEMSGFNDRLLLLEVYGNRAMLMADEGKSSDIERYIHLLKRVLDA
jgi:hypothetical protein